MNVADIVNLIRSTRIDLSDEKRAQADLESAFVQAHWSYCREVSLTREDIVDFMVYGVAVEVKLKGAKKRDVFRQLSRYAKHPTVDAIILASNMSMGLPTQIEGKDAYFVKLGEAWL